MRRNKPNPIVVVALPLAYQDGMDKYDGVMRYLREAKAEWELRIVREAQDIELFRRCLEEPVDGLICGTVGRFADNRRDLYLPMECLDFCRRRKIPLVGLDWPLEELNCRQLKRASFLNIDSEQIGAYAADVLLGAGAYTSYGFVGMYPESAWSRDRGAFFARRLRKAGRRNVNLFKGDILSDEPELQSWLKGLEKPAAVFASNDCAADVVLKVCRRSGLRVPEELAVLGVDDDPVFCVHTRPTLSSVRPNFRTMGYLAARELSRLMSGRATGREAVVAGDISVTLRMSTAPSSPAGALVRRADEIIASRACEAIDSNAIAAELKISRRLLDFRYRQISGISVREAIVRMRIEKAKRLLSYSGHTIGTICRLCGYRTESYFEKVFLAHERVSMGKYRSRCRHDEKK